MFPGVLPSWAGFQKIWYDRRRADDAQVSQRFAWCCARRVNLSNEQVDQTRRPTPLPYCFQEKNWFRVLGPNCSKSLFFKRVWPPKHTICVLRNERNLASTNNSRAHKNIIDTIWQGANPSDTNTCERVEIKPPTLSRWLTSFFYGRDGLNSPFFFLLPYPFFYFNCWSLP